MRQAYIWEFDAEELQIIKSALMGKLDRRSPHYEKALQLAAQLPVDPIHHNYSDRHEGLTESIIESLQKLKTATAAEIEEHLGLPKPNSVSPICSKLAKQGILTRETIEPSKANQRGLAAKYRYSIKETHA
jgi:hypothetical protein